MNNSALNSISISRLLELPTDVIELAAAAHAEGFFMLDRLIERFESHQNRFVGRGEALFGVMRSGCLLGIGGLNIDPYFNDPQIGRVRHLYIHQTERQKGLGRLLVESIETEAAFYFHKLQLYTPTESAARFYEAIGFTPVSGQAKVTHIKVLPYSA